MPTAALFTVAKEWKQPKYPSIDEWMNKMWCIHTMQYYSVFKRKEVLTHTTILMKLYAKSQSKPVTEGQDDSTIH